jgi:hypothetical protein
MQLRATPAQKPQRRQVPSRTRLSRWRFPERGESRAWSSTKTRASAKQTRRSCGSCGLCLERGGSLQQPVHHRSGKGFTTFRHFWRSQPEAEVWVGTVPCSSSAKILTLVSGFLTPCWVLGSENPLPIFLITISNP